MPRKSEALDLCIHRRLSTLALSDAFRRSAELRRVDAAAAIVRATRMFMADATSYNPHEAFRHAKLAKRLIEHVQNISDAALALRVNEIELPVSRNLPGFEEFLRENVLGKIDGPHRFVLQQGEYRAHLSVFGPVDGRVRTALDKGMRGLADIKSELGMS